MLDILSYVNLLNDNNQRTLEIRVVARRSVGKVRRASWVIMEQVEVLNRKAKDLKT